MPIDAQELEGSVLAVDIMIDDDSFKITYQIIKELSEVWDTLSETTRANITELIGGGVRNANVINAIQNEFGTRLGGLETELYEEPRRVNNTIREAIDNLRIELDTFKAALIEHFNTFSNNLQSCAKDQDLVDEQGGSLDKFLESFRRY